MEAPKNKSRFSPPSVHEKGRPKGRLFHGRDDRIRTCGILLPKQALYQTEPHPDALIKNIRDIRENVLDYINIKIFLRTNYYKIWL